MLKINIDLKNKPIRHILVIRFRRVGDAVLSTVICSTLKRSFPSARIDYVLNENIAPLFEHHPDIDNLITFNDQELKSPRLYFPKVRKIMKEGRYDIIVDMRATIKTLIFTCFSLSTPYRIGRKKYYNFVHNMQTHRDAVRYPNKNDTEFSLELLMPLEKYFKIHYVKKFKLYLTDKEKSDYKAYMIEQGIDFNKPVLACGATTRIKTKRWNLDYMSSILLKIMAEFKDMQLIFNYTGDEKEDVTALYHLTGRHPNIKMNIEAKGLRDLMALLSNVDLYFGNEGGARHIAQALDIPSFAIFPYDVPKTEWLPYPNENNCGLAPSDLCNPLELNLLTAEEQNNLITVDEVWKRLHPMLCRILKS